MKTGETKPGEARLWGGLPGVRESLKALRCFAAAVGVAMRVVDAMSMSIPVIARESRSRFKVLKLPLWLNDKAGLSGRALLRVAVSSGCSSVIATTTFERHL